MVAIINWEHVDRKSLADSMANTLPELDTIEAILYSSEGLVAKAHISGMSAHNQEINIMDDLLAAGDTREVIKIVEIDARNYVIHGINLKVGNILGLIYSIGTPYGTIRKQSSYFLELLKQVSQLEGKTSNLAAQAGNELIKGSDFSVTKSPEEVKSTSNVSTCTKKQSGTPATDAEKTSPATVPSANSWDQYYLGGWN